MSILSALFPLALSVSPQALAAAVTPTPQPVVLPVATTPAAKPFEVKFSPPAARPVAKPAPAIARPGDAEEVNGVLRVLAAPEIKPHVPLVPFVLADVQTKVHAVVPSGEGKLRDHNTNLMANSHWPCACSPGRTNQ